MPSTALRRTCGADAAPDHELDLADISPRLLSCFVAVAQERHFSRAADRLYVAQSALSRSIQQLERLLGRQLFVRTTRSVELTPAGLRLLGPAGDVLDALGDLAGELAGRQRTLRVAHIPATDTTSLILERFGPAWPAIAVAECILDGPAQLRALRDGEIDVAVVPGPPPTDRALRAELVRLDPLLIAVIGRRADITRPVDPGRRTVAVAAPLVADPVWTAFVDGFERRAGCRLRRVPVLTGTGTEAYAMRRAGVQAFATLASSVVGLDEPCPAFGSIPVQAYMPWSIAWRAGRRTGPVASFLAAAREVARTRAWTDRAAWPGDPWIGGDVASREASWTLAA